MPHICNAASGAAAQPRGVGAVARAGLVGDRVTRGVILSLLGIESSRSGRALHITRTGTGAGGWGPEAEPREAGRVGAGASEPVAEPCEVRRGSLEPTMEPCEAGAKGLGGWLQSLARTTTKGCGTHDGGCGAGSSRA
ncbi:hypothetical protein GUJ93_ZPchr0014g47614 [Zizania palustris]|uniref:Uncharacterized protein n=1 Tax=Zizania palustris TaxID=103762 RepID=A0A8J5SWZ7_ZIZPA|nr:hypothetical protein GUJ93_ZPchr0014g47614 [Zizania palustris]